jgi:hypothetical protein
MSNLFGFMLIRGFQSVALLWHLLIREKGIVELKLLSGKM